MDYEKEIKNLRLEVDELKSLLNNSIHTAGYARTVEEKEIKFSGTDICQECNKSFAIGQMNTTNTRFMFFKCWDENPVDKVEDSVEAYIYHSNLHMLLDTGSACEVDISHGKEDGYAKVKIIRIGE